MFDSLIVSLLGPQAPEAPQLAAELNQMPSCSAASKPELDAELQKAEMAMCWRIDDVLEDVVLEDRYEKEHCAGVVRADDCPVAERQTKIIDLVSANEELQGIKEDIKAAKTEASRLLMIVAEVRAAAEACAAGAQAPSEHPTGEPHTHVLEDSSPGSDTSEDPWALDLRKTVEKLYGVSTPAHEHHSRLSKELLGLQEINEELKDENLQKLKEEKRQDCGPASEPVGWLSDEHVAEMYTKYRLVKVKGKNPKAYIQGMDGNKWKQLCQCNKIQCKGYKWLMADLLEQVESMKFNRLKSKEWLQRLLAMDKYHWVAELDSEEELDHE